MSAACRIRRATVDDLPGLRALWEAMLYPVADLEGRLTDFYVAESGDGALLGTIAISTQARQAWLYAESFGDFGLADRLRPLFWERFQLVAANRGAARVWTQEEAPFWSRNGFRPATAEDLQRLPPEWAALGGRWLTCPLRDDSADAVMDKQLQVLTVMEKSHTEQARHRVKLINLLATLLAIIIALFVIFAVFQLLRRDPRLPGQ